MITDFQLLSIDASASFLLLLGLMVGILSGLLGVGGGVLLTPALHILGMPMPLAVGTTLTQMVASSLTGAIKHFRQKNILLPIVMIFGFPAIIGVWIGRNLMMALDQQGKADSWTAALYSLLLLYLGYSMFRRTKESQKQMQTGKLRPQKPRLPSLFRWFWLLGPRLSIRGYEHLPLISPLLLGLMVGIISSLTGLGGGFFYVPIMAGFLSIDIKEAIGTSLACVFLGSLVAASGYYQANMVDLGVALYLAIGSIVGSVIGANATRYAKGNMIRYFFAFLVWTAALSMLVQQAGFAELSYYLHFYSSLIVVLSAILNAIYHFLAEQRKKN